MKIIRVGVDIAKSVFHCHGVDRFEKTQWQGKYRRERWLNALSKRVSKGSEIGMEACASSHYWGRELQKMGYKVKLVAAQFVKPYVKSNKNDAVDAEAICEPMSRPNMRFVAVKSVQQQDVQASHRIRDTRIGWRIWPYSPGWYRAVTKGIAYVDRRCAERVDRSVSRFAERISRRFAYP